MTQFHNGHQAEMKVLINAKSFAQSSHFSSDTTILYVLLHPFFLSSTLLSEQAAELPNYYTEAGSEEASTTTYIHTYIHIFRYISPEFHMHELY